VKDPSGLNNQAEGGNRQPYGTHVTPGGQTYKIHPSAAAVPKLRQFPKNARRKARNLNKFEDDGRENDKIETHWASGNRRQGVHAVKNWPASPAAFICRWVSTFSKKRTAWERRLRTPERRMRLSSRAVRGCGRSKVAAQICLQSQLRLLDQGLVTKDSSHGRLRGETNAKGTPITRAAYRGPRVANWPADIGGRLKGNDNYRAQAERIAAPAQSPNGKNWEMGQVCGPLGVSRLLANQAFLPSLAGLRG